MEKLNWQAISSVITFLAVLVALFPIFQGWIVRKSSAKNLRLRLAAKLLRIKTSVMYMLQSDNEKSFLCLNYDDYKLLHENIEAMLQEASVLLPDEKDILSQIHINLELMLPYIKNKKLTDDSAEILIMLIDRFLVVIEENGLMSGQPLKPWLK